MKFEEQIVQAVLEKKNKKVISALYKNSYPKVETSLKKMGAHSDDIQDVFQDAMIILVRKIRNGSFRQQEDISSFLFIISRNLWYNKTAQINKKASIDELEHKTDWNEDVLYQSKVSEREQTIKSMLEALGEKCSHVFKSMLFTDKKYKDIAEDLGFSSESVVKVVKSRCKDKLIKLLRKDDGLRETLIDYDERFTKYI